MKSLFILLMSCCVVNAQQDTNRLKIKTVVHYTASFIAGSLDGFIESLNYHYDSGVKKRLPNINDQFWNPAISWRNKYKNGEPSEGAKFPGSTNFFVFTTDGYHLMRLLHKTTSVSIILSFDTPKGDRKVLKYLLKTVLISASYTLGKTLMYDVVFKN